MTFEANLPWVVDMIMTWHLGMATLETLYRSWSDEAKVPYGYGQHLLTGRSDVGQMNGDYIMTMIYVYVLVRILVNTVS